MATRRRKRRSPFELLDPRQRLAIALLIGAVQLPAEMMLCAELWREADRAMPGLDVQSAHLGDRPGALAAARALIDDLIAHPAPPAVPEAC